MRLSSAEEKQGARAAFDKNILERIRRAGTEASSEMATERGPPDKVGNQRRKNGNGRKHTMDQMPRRERAGGEARVRCARAWHPRGRHGYG